MNLKRNETELALIIKERIRSHGPLTFRTFMAMALYDFQYGFYSQGPAIGSSDGPFDTNAKFPAFAFGLAQAITQAEQIIGSPLRVIELGGGTGQLGQNLLSFLRLPHEYLILETSPGLRAVQQEKGLHSVETITGLLPSPTIVFGNEVLDALPVHRVVGMGNNEVVELVVDLDEQGELFERPDSLLNPGLASRLIKEGIQLGRGQIAEICLEFKTFLQELHHLLNPGYIIFVDYGDKASNLYSYQHRNGTLRSYYQQQQIHDPFFAVGQQDLTVDVDYTALISDAREVGLEFAGSASQGRWLRNLGIQNYIGLGVNKESDQAQVDRLMGDASLGSAFDVLMFKTQGLPVGPGLQPIM